MFLLLIFLVGLTANEKWLSDNLHIKVEGCFVFLKSYCSFLEQKIRSVLVYFE